MPWYGWLSLVLFLVTLAAWIVWWLVLRSRRVNAVAKVARLEKDLERTLVILEEERAARVRAEQIKVKRDLAVLEENHKVELEKLNAEERENYEKIKENPQAGVDFVLGLLDQPGTS